MRGPRTTCSALAQAITEPLDYLPPPDYHVRDTRSGRKRAMGVASAFIDWTRRQERRPVMPNFQRIFVMSRRSRQLKTIIGIALPIALIATLAQVALPTSSTRAVAALATPMYGCASPSDCVSKMTLPEKEGQMTQVE